MMEAFLLAAQVNDPQVNFSINNSTQLNAFGNALVSA